MENAKEIIDKMLNVKESWLIDNKVNEIKFVAELQKIMQLYYINNSFYYINGMISSNKLKSIIQGIISPFILSRVATATDNIIKAMENYCFVCEYNPTENVINVSNGTITIKEKKIHFNNEKIFSVNRLNVEYLETNEAPIKWLEYLNDLLEQKDIEILQEYIGYCLIPSLRGQKALFIIGSGGEGKSVLGKVLADIFGTSMTSDNIHSLFEGKFGLTNIDMKLVIYDDDLKGCKLKDSALFKSLISGGKISFEKKFKDKAEIEPYAKFLACGNTMLQASNDDSNGFKRRLLILLTKDKPKDRKDNPYLVASLLKEKSQILNWALEGLIKLIKNDFIFSYNEDMTEKVDMLLTSGNSKDIMEFLTDNNYVELGGSDFTSTQELYNHFLLFARNNNLEEINSSTFNKRLASIHSKYSLQRGKSVIDKTGKEIRGYIGIKIIPKID